MSKEPAVGIGVVISAVMTVIWLVMKEAGIDITQGLQDSIDVLILLVFQMPAITGFLIRTQVVPTAKAEELIAEAYVAQPGIDPEPQV